MEGVRFYLYTVVLVFGYIAVECFDFPASVSLHTVENGKVRCVDHRFKTTGIDIRDAHYGCFAFRALNTGLGSHSDAVVFQFIHDPSRYLQYQGTKLKIFTEQHVFKSLADVASSTHFIPKGSGEPGWYQFEQDGKPGTYIYKDDRTGFLKIGTDDGKDNFEDRSTFWYSPHNFKLIPKEDPNTCFPFTASYAIKKQISNDCHQFRVKTPGWSGTPGTVSFEAADYSPNFYLVGHQASKLILNRVTRSYDVNTFIVEESETYPGYFHLIPEGYPGLVLSTMGDVLITQRDFGYRKTDRRTLFGFKVPDASLPGGGGAGAGASTSLSDTAFKFTLPHNSKPYILDLKTRNTLKHGELHCRENYNMSLAHINDEETMTAISDAFFEIEERTGKKLGGIATGDKIGIEGCGSTPPTGVLPIEDLNPAGLHCVIIAKAKGVFQPLSKPCDRFRPVLCEGSAPDGPRFC